MRFFDDFDEAVGGVVEEFKSFVLLEITIGIVGRSRVGSSGESHVLVEKIGVVGGEGGVGGGLGSIAHGVVGVGLAGEWSFLVRWRVGDRSAGEEISLRIVSVGFLTVGEDGAF